MRRYIIKNAELKPCKLLGYEERIIFLKEKLSSEDVNIKFESVALLTSEYVERGKKGSATKRKELIDIYLPEIMRYEAFYFYKGSIHRALGDYYYCKFSEKSLDTYKIALEYFEKVSEKEKKDYVKLEIIFSLQGIASVSLIKGMRQESYLASSKALKLLRALRNCEGISEFGIISYQFSICCSFLKKHRESIMSLMFYLKKMNESISTHDDRDHCHSLFRFHKFQMINLVSRNLQCLGRVKDSMTLKERSLVLCHEFELNEKLRILEDLMIHFCRTKPCKKKFLQFYNMIPSETTKDHQEEIKKIRKNSNEMLEHFGPSTVGFFVEQVMVV